jgi:hypothetical protein
MDSGNSDAAKESVENGPLILRYTQDDRGEQGTVASTEWTGVLDLTSGFPCNETLTVV